ncbi:hypothetical protein GGI12_005084 [Dipsacomyces acuminosporus]|nr:hypothetical protein GGI12_005084 [Dipsacomyces acuminosporus]
MVYIKTSMDFSKAPIQASIVPDINKRIIGGFELSGHDAPFAAKIFFDLGNGTARNCGGSIISKNHILTAAHCVYYDEETLFAPEQTIIGYGDDNVKRQTKVKAIELTPHPYYTTNTADEIYLNDIAIITVPDIELDENTRTISIYTGKLSSGNEVVALGWGATSEKKNATLPLQLKGALLQVGDLAGCQKIYPSYTSSNGPKICVLNKYHPESSTCKGDSGTAVIVRSTNGYYLAGLDSQGGKLFKDSKCGFPGGFTLFTRADYQLDFVVSATGLPLRYLTRTYLS